MDLYYFPKKSKIKKIHKFNMYLYLKVKINILMNLHRKTSNDIMEILLDYLKLLVKSFS